MSKMRTIMQAAEYIKTHDPDSALTKTAIRRLVITGAIPTVRAGTKYLLDLDNLDAYLTNGGATHQQSTGGIRSVEVNVSEHA